ncbi:MAG: UvrD-helicase domain-containing protein [Eubacterium sp.]|jgi:ATP-dependent helicase/nuclease subunit A|nr:UvrD-helicase domain-containing protein [Eubacterium sp.]
MIYHNWTSEQLAAIDHRGSGAIVSAAAGGGKTAVLVERACRIISDAENKIPADRLVITTFTKKAAGEIRARLTASISDLAEKQRSVWLDEQLIRLEEAQISTISSFCLSLIRGFEDRLGLATGFRVMDEIEGEELMRRALDFACNEMYDALDEEELNSLHKISGIISDRPLREALSGLYTAARQSPYPDKWIAEKIAYPDKRFIIAFAERLVEKLDDKFKKNISKLIQSFDKAKSLQEPLIPPLIKLYKLFTGELDRLKTAANAIDFDDIEHYALKLLKIEKNNLSSRFDEIIVDEFQDSNFVQYEIFKLLSKDERNIFFVGDIKQSIYRFRNADPEVFTKVMENSNYKKLYLNKNFRSSAEVINSVNSVFAGVMTKEYGGVDYDESQKLVCGREESFGEAARTRLYLLDLEERMNLRFSSDEFEARFIAKHIKSYVSKGADGYNDFAVIFSALSGAEKTYLRVFGEYGVPVSRGGKGGEYIKLKEIDVVLKLLDVIFDPYKDFELLSVLMSPLFGFSAWEIGEMRARNKEIPLYSNLLAYEKSNKTESFLKDLARWRSMSENRPLSSLLLDIAGSDPANLLIASADSPKKAAANINLLNYYANSLSDMTGGSSQAFLRLMKVIKENEKKLVEADMPKSGGQGAVKLMTIHASKGLEFKICYLPGISKKFNLRDSFGDVIIDNKCGIAMRYIEPKSKIRYETLTHFAAAERIRAMALDEEMRKLYVAMTRARERLILVGSDRIENGEIKPANKNSFIQTLLISNSLPVVFPKAEEFINVDSAPESSGSESRPAVILIETGEYRRRELTKLPKKLTATDINYFQANNLFNFDQSDEPSVFPRVPSFLKERRLTGKKRGDAYHKLMELINFAAEDYQAQIEKLKPRFDEQEWNAINFRQILDFFESPLGRRAAAAKVEKEFPIYTEVSFKELGFSELDEKYDERMFVQGIADMFFYENGDIILVDYKTNRNTGHEKLKAEYGGQLGVYKRALTEMTGLSVRECWIYSFEEGAVQI